MIRSPLKLEQFFAHLHTDGHLSVAADALFDKGFAAVMIREFFEPFLRERMSHKFGEYQDVDKGPTYLPYRECEVCQHRELITLALERMRAEPQLPDVRITRDGIHPRKCCGCDGSAHDRMCPTRRGHE